jgi:ribosomal protein S12 methylthiotransferase
VIAEARHLARTGAKEINLIAQDVTQYGFDLYKEFTLPKLLRELNAVEGIEWIRLLYFYPNRLTDEVIETMATCEKVLPYIDIPLQHAHPDTLRRMKRPWDGDRYLNLFAKVRKAMPTCAIRTTFIVGFPGETEQEFQYLLDFTKAARLDRVGAFVFSKEPGTPAHDLPDQVSFKNKRERYDRVMTLQQQISLEINESWIGQELDVLIEDSREGWLIGRSHRDAPEIDGMVFLQGKAVPGQIVRAKVNDAEPYDLYAKTMRAPIAEGKRLVGLRQAVPARPL